MRSSARCKLHQIYFRVKATHDPLVRNFSFRHGKIVYEAQKLISDSEIVGLNGCHDLAVKSTHRKGMKITAREQRRRGEKGNKGKEKNPESNVGAPKEKKKDSPLIGIIFFVLRIARTSRIMGLSTV